MTQTHDITNFSGTQTPVMTQTLDITKASHDKNTGHHQDKTLHRQWTPPKLVITQTLIMTQTDDITNTCQHTNTSHDTDNGHHYKS